MELKLTNPSVRFGNISMMPKQPIKREDGSLQESLLVEARSLPGYSGSPVFFYEKHGLNRRHISPQLDLRLLGLDWGHMRQRERILLENGDPHAVLTVETNSGMMGVVPAWKIQELLDSMQLVAEREASEAKLAETNRKAPGGLISHR
jgi:hypothetical protein